MKPGIYHDLTREEYRAIPAVNQSTLKDFMKNPRAWREGLPARESESLQWGSLFELLLFEGLEAWEKRYYLLDSVTKQALLEQAQERQKGKKSETFSRSLTEYKEWAAKMEGSGKTEIDEGLLKGAQIAVKRALEEPNIKSLASLPKRHEVAIVWEDPDTKLLCKGLIDWVPEGIASLVDVKTTKELVDVSAEQASWKFARAVRNLGYDMQAAAYLLGWTLAHEQAGKRADLRHGWLFVCSANKKPWSPAAYRLSTEAIQQGLDKWRHGLHIWRKCHETDIWPGLTDQEEWPELPVLKP